MHGVPMSAVAVRRHPDRAEAIGLVDELAGWLDERGHHVVDDVATADLVVSVGGDGTMLRAVDEAARHGVPVLGVNVGPHDGAAALLQDGAIVSMIEQERISRRRYALGESPSDAVWHCLRHAGIGIEDVSEIAVGWNVPLLAEIEDARFDEAEFVDWLLGPTTPSTRPLVTFVDHHLAHAASASISDGSTSISLTKVFTSVSFLH